MDTSTSSNSVRADERFCDLHTHSTASDGTDTPAALAHRAAQLGLSALALTDHDTTAGLVECEAACDELGIAFVPGIEVSADPGPVAISGAGDGRDDPDARRGTLHLLGLFVRHDDSRLRAVHERMRLARDERNPAIVQKLKTLGIDIEYEQVLAHAREQGTAIIGRPHIAHVLIANGHARSVREAFERYLGRGGGAYVRRDRLDPADAIDAIHHAGGLAIVAHPVQLGIRDFGRLAVFMDQLKGLGLDGIETRHSDHTPEQIERFERLARKLGLLTSGGSDYHGRRKAIELGSRGVPFEVYERLAAAARGRGGMG